MNPILAAGLLIGVFCGLWTFIMGFTGWYKDPAMMNAFFVVILVEVFGLVWGMRQTARQGRGWASQVLAGTFMSIIAGIVIIASSLLFTTVFFPDYFAEIEQMGREVMQRDGKSETEIAEALEANRPMANPMAQALAGFTGTLITGIVASAAIALVIRAKRVNPNNGQPPSTNSQTSNAQTSNAQTSNAQTGNAQTSNAQTSNAQTSNAQTSNAQTGNAQTGNAQTGPV